MQYLFRPHNSLEVGLPQSWRWAPPEPLRCLMSHFREPCAKKDEWLVS